MSVVREIGAGEAIDDFGALLDRVERGEEIVITRHGKSVARIVPDTASPNRDQARAAAERLLQRAAQSGHGPFDWQALKADRDAGRR